MENINQIIAINLKRIREKQDLSLEKTSELTGVSKTMLYQIEKAESSPSINTLYKIANALKISLSSLISSRRSNAVVVNKNDLMSVNDEGNNMRIYTMFPFNNKRNFEIFYGEVEPKGKINSEAHQVGTEEYLTVFSGELRIMLGEIEYIVPEQHAIGFCADVPHSYINQGKTIVTFCNTIYYSE
ncbi:MAG: helix-turn-helix domain-containing protein [Ruminiclostridium sp.]